MLEQKYKIYNMRNRIILLQCFMENDLIQTAISHSCLKYDDAMIIIIRTAEHLDSVIEHIDFRGEEKKVWMI